MQENYIQDTASRYLQALLCLGIEYNLIFAYKPTVINNDQTKSCATFFFFKHVYLNTHFSPPSGVNSGIIKSTNQK